MIDEVLDVFGFCGDFGRGFSGNAFSTRHDVLSFSCVTTAITGMCCLNFDRLKSEIVEAVRTFGARYKYELH